MEIKTFEVRDAATFIPCIGIKLAPFMEQKVQDRYLLRRAGYASPCVLFMKAEGGDCRYDPYDWPERGRTMAEAHNYIENHWDELESGAVIDVQFILGETTTIKTTENTDHEET